MCKTRHCGRYCDELSHKIPLRGTYPPLSKSEIRIKAVTMDKVHCLTARSSKVSAFCKKKPNLPQLLPFYRMYFKALACLNFGVYSHCLLMALAMDKGHCLLGKLRSWCTQIVLMDRLCLPVVDDRCPQNLSSVVEANRTFFDRS